jgi:hypothetical protein
MAEMEPKKSNIVALPFSIARVSATDTPTNMTAFQSGSSAKSTRLSIPFDGSVVALSACGRTAVGTGSCTFRLFDAGTASSPVISTALTTTNSIANNTALRRGVYAVSENDYLGVSFTSTTLYAGTQSNFVATVWVHLEQN